MRILLKMQIISAFGSQRRFAKVCNKTDDWISKIILGIKTPNKNERELICSILGIEDKEYIFVDREIEEIKK